jgi:hypothetical protein
MSALFHCFLQLTVIQWNKADISCQYNSTVNHNGIKQKYLANITVNCKQQWNKADISCQHCFLQLTVMFKRNFCFIPLLFTVDSYIDNTCLFYSIVAYSWQLCWKEISALFHWKYLANITVNCKQQWNKADISCQHKYQL